MNPSGLTRSPIAVLPDAQEVKADMRERIRAERRGRDHRRLEADAWALAAIALEQPEIASARCVATYASTSSAPGTLPLRQALRSNGTRVLLPVLQDDDRPTWSVDGDGEPCADALDGVEVMLVPALAVDTLGNRLGQGAGFYDRALRGVDPKVRVFAVVYESEVLDAAVEPVPAETHDHLVDAVITPTLCLRLPPSRR